MVLKLVCDGKMSWFWILDDGKIRFFMLDKAVEALVLPRVATKYSNLFSSNPARN